MDGIMTDVDWTQSPTPTHVLERDYLVERWTKEDGPTWQSFPHADSPMHDRQTPHARTFIIHYQGVGGG
jgi:hypothetical protein